nr:MAG TPA: hypothetical protein [Caudoviricetes sp.]
MYHIFSAFVVFYYLLRRLHILVSTPSLYYYNAWLGIPISGFTELTEFKDGIL